MPFQEFLIRGKSIRHIETFMINNVKIFIIITVPLKMEIGL